MWEAILFPVFVGVVCGISAFVSFKIGYWTGRRDAANLMWYKVIKRGGGK